MSSHPSTPNPLTLLNPGNLDEEIARISLLDADGAVAMADASVEAFPDWSSRTMEARCAILSRAMDLLENRADEVAECIMLENGKPRAEARMEVKAALGDARFQIAQAGKIPERESIRGLDDSVAGEVRHAPLGLVLVITPWNFPLATVVRKLVPALAWGNTVVAKPAQQTPIAPTLLFECLAAAGLPTEVAQLAIGKGSAIGNVLCDHPALRAISFTGSTEVGLGICQRAATRNVKLQMEMGGKNAAVILADANLDAAVEAVRTAAFTCSGQWCTATSRVIVEAPVYEDFCRKLSEAVQQLRMGPGHIAGVTFGPVASAAQRRTAIEAIHTARAQGARLLCGGKTPETIDDCRGHFVEPTVFADVTESMHLFQEEVFGPVLAVTRASDARDALRLANASPYGLSFSIFTQSNEAAEHFMEQVEAGMVHHNLHTAVRHPALPVTGWKESGRGIPECGLYARDFYTQPKAIYRSAEN